jgi:hypothetical protein
VLRKIDLIIKRVNPQITRIPAKILKQIAPVPEVTKELEKQTYSNSADFYSSSVFAYIRVIRGSLSLVDQFIVSLKRVIRRC